MLKSKKWSSYYPGLLFFAVFINYSNTLFNSFAWDDRAFILSNPFIMDLRNLRLFFSREYVNLSPEFIDLQRPLMTVSLMLDYYIWKLNPFGYHLTNLILHCANTIILFRLLMTISEERTAFLSALIFGIHPINTEAVNGINFREDILATFFYLLAFISFIKCQKSYWYYGVISILFYTMALLSKEMSITLPVLLIIYQFYFYRYSKNTASGNGKMHWVYGGYAIISALYIWCISILTPYFTGNTLISYVTGSGYHLNSPTIPIIIAYYMKLIFFPLNLSAVYEIRHSISFIDTKTLLSIAFLLTILTCSLYVRKKQPLLTFGVLWFFITILPMSNLFRMSDPVAERYLYLPSIGICLVICFGLSKWFYGKKRLEGFVAALTVLLLLLYAVLTFERNLVWCDDYTLWSDAVKKTPQKLMAHINLALAAEEKESYKVAIREFNEVLKVTPDHWIAKTGLIRVNEALKKKEFSR